MGEGSESKNSLSVRWTREKTGLIGVRFSILSVQLLSVLVYHISFRPGDCVLDKVQGVVTTLF